MSVDPATAPYRPAYARDGSGNYYRIGGGGGSSTMATMPPGTVISSNSTSRPSARPDLVCIFTGATDPGTAALDGDIWLRTT